MNNEELQKKIDEISEELIDYGDAVVILISGPGGAIDELRYSYRGSYHAVLGTMADMKTVLEIARIDQCKKGWNEDE